MTDIDKKIEEVKAYIDKTMADKRKQHTYGVVETSIKLAERYGVDSKKAELAAFCHDIFKGIHGDDINPYVKECGLSDKYLGNPNLAHSKIAAKKIPEMFGIDDEDVINAVCYHTTGRAGMSNLEMIIYYADMIEPNREYPSVEYLRSIAFSGLKRACMISMEEGLEFLKQQGKEIDLDTLDAIAWLKGEKE